MKFAKFTCAASALTLALLATPAFAQSTDDRLDTLEARIMQLEAANRELMEMLAASRAASQERHDVEVTVEHHGDHQAHHGDRHEMIHVAHNDDAPVAIESTSELRGLVGTNAEYSYSVLDHAENTNTHMLTQLEALQNRELHNRVTLGGGVTVLANYQTASTDSKFGWLMRHPTSNNQIGETVSEMVVHSANLAMTARLSDNITGYVEMLYNPEQSFGQGTITALGRNVVQMRRAYVMWGDLNESPVYAAIGKMDTPFGLNDTVSPFTNSSNWQSFAGLAYGGMVGYTENGFNLRAMAIQGGAQFRAHNSPVENTSVPSRLNNFAVDANYTADMGGGNSVMLGASYTHGSAYCQSYPITHFTPCQDNNPAYSVYSRMNLGGFELLGEFASTTEVWPGTQVPFPAPHPLAGFEAHEAQAFTLGGRTAIDMGHKSDVMLSLEFSRFIAGPDGAPWERQNQFVAGVAYDVAPGVNMFGEYIHVDGWAPLNFVSGGNQPAGATWSERDATTDVFLFGVQAAF